MTGIDTATRVILETIGRVGFVMDIAETPASPNAWGAARLAGLVFTVVDETGEVCRVDDPTYLLAVPDRATRRVEDPTYFLILQALGHLLLP